MEAAPKVQHILNSVTFKDDEQPLSVVTKTPTAMLKILDLKDKNSMYLSSS